MKLNLGHSGAFSYFKERFKAAWELALRPFHVKAYKPAWLWDSLKFMKTEGNHG